MSCALTGSKPPLLAILLLFLPALVVAQEDPVAFYSFENGFADSSGHGLAGIPLGNAATAYDTDRQSHVLRLDGSGSCVDLGNNTLVDWSGTFTCAFWVKVHGWHGAWDTILKKSGAWSFERHIDTHMLAFCSWPHFVPTTVPLAPDGVWHHVAATYDGVTQSIYIDGTLQAAVTNPGTIAVNANHVFIGAAEGTTRFFDGWLDDLRLYSRILTETEIESLAGIPSDVHGTISRAVEIEGNYEVNAQVADEEHPGKVRLCFSANQDFSRYAFADIQGDVLRIGRHLSGVTSVWKSSPGVGSRPWRIRILRKGNFFRFWVNGATSWMRGPLGEWDGIYEPRKAWAGVMAPDSGTVQSFSVTALPWLEQVTQPLIPRGPAGSYYEAQIIPGALLKYGGKYYIYFMAGKSGTQEGAASRTIGVASSPDLRAWTVEPEPILSYSDLGGQGDNLYPGGAVVTPEGKIALMYAVQKFPSWKGFYLATADHPLGPFTNWATNPVYQFAGTAHEFDLVRVDQPEHRYILMFAGFTPNPPSGPAGDRAYAIYSDDLVTWQADTRNPVFGPSTLDNWDAVHVRPRSLHLIGDTYYLWYEGANTWTPPNPAYNTWWDAVGLARSRDLVHWEHYPRNPALPGLGIGATQWDKNWIGWPRMLVENDTGYVFYTGDGETGMRTIPMDRLVNWAAEGEAVNGVKEETHGAPRDLPGLANEYVLYPNYPNPFNPITTIRFAIPHASRVTITISNVPGQVIRTLLDDVLAAGSHTISFDASGLSSGLYFCTMRSPGFAATNKVTVLR